MDTTEKISLYKNISGYLARHYEVLPEEPPMERSIIPENIGEECNGIVAPHTQCKSGNKEARTVAHSRAKPWIPRDIEFFRKFFAEDEKKSASAKTLDRSYSDEECVAPPLPSNFSESVIDRLEDSFGTLLVKAISKRGLNNADVYKDANIDRRLFSKIISNEGYSPTKGTVLALAIALKLNLDETTSFLKSAGYALSHSSKSDLVVEYFIGETNGNYNIDIVNDALEHFGQPPLGSRL